MSSNKNTEAAKLIYNGTLIFLGIAVGIFNIFIQNIIIKNIFLFSLFIILSIISAISSLILSYSGLINDNSKYIKYGFIASLVMLVCLIIIYLSLINTTVNTNVIVNMSIN